MTKTKKHSTHFEYSAGGIVFRQTPRGTEIAFILDPYHKWTFAKGHIEKGERRSTAARREVSEEMGVSKHKLKIITPLGCVDWKFREKLAGRPSPMGSLVHKFAYFFLMQVPTNANFNPRAKEQIHSVKWVSFKEVLKISSYRDVDQVLKKAVNILKRKRPTYSSPVKGRLGGVLNDS